MSGELHGTNTILAGDQTFLLAETSGGEVVHLVRPHEPPGAGRSAVHDFYFDDSHDRHLSARQNYDRDALLQPRWSESTICGRIWATMAAGDGGPLRDDDAAFAPTCRRCLSLLDRLFPAPEVDDRLTLVAQLAADVVAERGYAEVCDVPGDQQPALRRTIRQLVRHRTGYATQTFGRASTVHVVCEEAHRRRDRKYEHEAMEAISAMLKGEEPRPIQTQDWVISWDTWNVG